jgi:hypothetical protein
MENNNLANTLLNSETQSIAPSYESSGFFSDMSYTIWVIILLILAFVGFNVYIYLAKGPQDIKNVFGRIKGFFTGKSENIYDHNQEQEHGQDQEQAHEPDQEQEHDHKQEHDHPQNVKIRDSVAQSSSRPQSVMENENKHDVTSSDHIYNTLNASDKERNDYMAHDAHSSLDVTGKAGWCYIGEDRGFRTCAEVGVNDKCMSGDIFPTRDICVNPNLRK